jgi:MAP/microtubule affinity-regulating kinase
MLCSSRPKDRSSTDFYSFGEVVGTGSFAKVRVAVHKLTGQRVAIKTYEKNKIKDAHALKRISQEIKLMERLDHPLISRFFEAIESARRIHIVMELIGEGNLCSYIKEKKSLREDEARNIFTQLCSAVEYLHSQHITHRDIKLENVLFDSQRNVKLIDFGFSVQCKEPKTLKVFCGTPSYMAPEIVRRSEYLGKPVDMWSLGVVLFAMLSGCFPFSAKTYPDLYKKVLKGSFKFPESFSPVVRHLVTNLLCGDANRRMKVAVAKAHPWLKSQPEVNFKYTPTATFTVSADAREDLYREAVNRMTTLGVDETTLCNDVCGKRRNSLTTCYYLLASAMSLRNKPGGL